SDSFCVYSDGSGYKGQVGAAAVARNKKDLDVSQQLHMGKLDEHTVYEAEVVGTILALDIICSQPRLCNVTILLDNQAAIKNLCHPKMKHSQHLI
ncbi:hypothetical protein K439DRAFT_1286751, partial [Ramaria rubella]